MCITTMIHRFRGVLSCRPTYPYPPRADVKLHRGGKRVCSNRFARAFARIAEEFAFHDSQSLDFCTKHEYLYPTRRINSTFPAFLFRKSTIYTSVWFMDMLIDRIQDNHYIDFVFGCWNWSVLDCCRVFSISIFAVNDSSLIELHWKVFVFRRKRKRVLIYHDSLKFCLIREKKLQTKNPLCQNLFRLKSIFQCKQFRYRASRFRAQFWNS